MWLKWLLSGAIALTADKLVADDPELSSSSPRAEAGLDEVRSVISKVQGRIRSIKVEMCLREAGKAGHELHEILAAKGRGRFISVRRFFNGSYLAALEDYDCFYDGEVVNVYGPVQHYCDTSKRFAVEPFTDKIRAHGFWDALGWWPPDDDSTPPS